MSRLMQAGMCCSVGPPSNVSMMRPTECTVLLDLKCVCSGGDKRGSCVQAKKCGDIGSREQGCGFIFLEVSMVTQIVIDFSWLMPTL